MNKNGFGKRPVAIHCYLCGQGYGTASIAIHVKACIKKWEIEQQQKPPKERRPIPKQPESFLLALSGKKLTGKEIDQINDEGFDEYNKKVLEPCEFCGRTFKPESLKVHQKSCTADRPLKPLPKRQEETEIGTKPQAQKLSQAPNTTVNKNKDSVQSSQITSKTNSNVVPTKKNLVQKVSQNIEEVEDDFDDVVKKPAKKSQKPETELRTKKKDSLKQKQTRAPAKQPTQELDEDRPAYPLATNSKLKQKPEDRPAPKPPVTKPQAFSVPIDEEDDGEPLDQNLEPCSKCGRNFAADRIAKHQKVCKVNAKPKKVKVFHKPLTENEKKKMDKTKTHKWKAQHEEFLQNIENMRKMKEIEAKGGNIRDLPPPPPSINAHYKECLYCGRKFNPEAHERHEKACKNTINKPKPVNKNLAVKPSKPVANKK